MAETAKIVINAVDNASNTLKGVGKAAGGLGKALDSSLRVAANFTIAVAGVSRAAKAMGAALAVPIRLSMEQERVETQLEAVLRSTAHAAGLNADQLKNMASSFQQATTFGDEAVIGAQNMLLTFTNIGGDGGIFERTTGTVLDMAAALGTDLKQQSIQVGKALNDPIKGVSALGEVGVAFTEDQKEMIKVLVESGETMKAQTLILDELQKEFGGSAEAARDTFGGALQSLENNWGDLLESAGDFITQNEGVKILISEISDVVAEWTSELSVLAETQEGQVDIAETMRTAILGVVSAVQATVTAFAFMGEVVFDVVTQIAELRGEILPLTKEQRDLANEIADANLELEGQVAAHRAFASSSRATTKEIEKGRLALGKKAYEIQQLHIQYEEATKKSGDFTGATEAINARLDALSDRLQAVNLAGEENIDITEGLDDRWKALSKGLQSIEPDKEAAQWSEYADSMREFYLASEDVTEQVQQESDGFKELAEEIARAEEAWQRSIESMSNRTADGFSDIFENWAIGQEGIEEGFTEFGDDLKATLADAFFTPMVGAESALQGVFESALKPVNQLGKAIGDQVFGTMISGIVGFFSQKKALEIADAAAGKVMTGEVLGAQITAVSAMMPALSAAATASLIATLGGAASAASLLPGLLATGAAAGKAAAAVSAIPFAEGGFVTEPTYSLTGEDGAEMILPLTKPSRARQLLAELPTRAPGLLGGGGGTVIRNTKVEVHLHGSDLTTDDVVDAINEQLGRIGGAF